MPFLPDWKGALNEAFANYVKAPLETKAQAWQTQFNQKAHEFYHKTNTFQHAIITILFASFCVGVIAITLKE